MLGLGNNITTTYAAESYLPTSVTGTLEFWVNVKQGVTRSVTGLANDDVHQWDDLSSTKKLVRLASNSAPQIKNSADITAADPINFLGDTNGDALKLQTSSNSNTEISLDQSDGGYTVCFIATNEALDSETVVFGSFSDDSAGVIWLDGDKVRFRANGQNFDFNASGINDDDFFSFMIVVHQGSSVNNAKLYINNNAADAKTITSDFVFGMVGGNNGAPKNFAESRIKQIILYNDAISDSDRNALYTNYISPAI